MVYNVFDMVLPWFQVISGLMQADPSVTVNSDNTAQLFCHEATRVFHDRLTDAEDKAMFYQSMSDILHDYFKVLYTFSMWIT